MLPCTQERARSTGTTHDSDKIGCFARRCPQYSPSRFPRSSSGDPFREQPCLSAQRPLARSSRPSQRTEQTTWRIARTLDVAMSRAMQVGLLHCARDATSCGPKGFLARSLRTVPPESILVLPESAFVSPESALTPPQSTLVPPEAALMPPEPTLVPTLVPPEPTHPARPTRRDPPAATHLARPTWRDPPGATHPARPTPNSYPQLRGFTYLLFDLSLYLLLYLL